MFVDTKEASAIIPVRKSWFARLFRKEPPDLTKPSKAGLVYLLRHREMWPDGFIWNYMNATSCAMGLAHQVWPKEIRLCASREVGKAIGISESRAIRVFFRAWDAFSLSSPGPNKIARMLVRSRVRS